MATLLPSIVLAAAVANQLSETTTVENVVAVSLTAKFVRAAGGATAKAWVQTSTDGDAWADVCSFAFTTTSLNKAAALTQNVAHTHATIVDAALADNTLLNGRLANKYRVKYTTTGTYTGASSLEITADFKVASNR